MIIITLFIKRIIIRAHTHRQRLETAKDSSGETENMASLLIIIMETCKAPTLQLKALLLLGKTFFFFSFDLKESRGVSVEEEVEGQSL